MTLKNYWKWPKFLSNFSIFGRNIEFFGPKIFSQILHPKTFLCAKIQLATWKTWFYIDFYRFWSKIANFGWPPLTLDPMSCPPYDPDLSRKNFIWSEKDSWEFTENFRSIRATIKKLFTKRSRGGYFSPPPPGAKRVKVAKLLFFSNFFSN